MPNSAPEPWPCCQKNVITPNVAASEIRFSRIAFAASTTERNARASSRNVSTATTLNISGKLPKIAWP